MDGWIWYDQVTFRKRGYYLGWQLTDPFSFFFLGCICDCGFEPTLGFDHPILCWDPFLFAVVLAFNDYYSLYMDVYALKA